MRTPASIAGHPIHPMVVPIAIGGFILSFAFDVVCLASGNTDPWARVALWTMVGGIVGALFAAVPGFIDMLSLQGFTKSIALKHMAINLTVVGLYICNAWMRFGDTSRVSGTAMLLSIVALALLVVSGWLGGKMVFEGGVGVDPNAEAPSTTARATSRQAHT